MAKSALLEQQMLALIFQGNAIQATGAAAGVTGGLANIAINPTNPLTSLYIALHTADPYFTGANGQANNEVTYTGYNRVAVNRSVANWAISGSNPAQVVPTNNIQFPAGTAGGGLATYWSIGVGPTPSANTGILYSGTISPSIQCGAGVTPILTTASTVTEQ